MQAIRLQQTDPNLQQLLHPAWDQCLYDQVYQALVVHIRDQHDRRYLTIRQLIVEGKHVNTDGRFDKLTDEEIDDLIEYVLSL